MDRRKNVSRRIQLERNLKRMRSSGRLRTVAPTPPEGEAADPFQALLPADLGALPELEELREEVHALRRLHEVIHFLGGAPDREALEGEVIDLALSVSGLTRGLLALRVRSDDDDAAPKFKVEQARGFDDEAKGAAETRVLRKILAHALEKRETVLEGAILDGGILGFARGADLALGAVAALPLEAGGEVLGALVLDDPARRVPFSPAEQRLLRSFGRHAGQALARIDERGRLERRVRRLQRRAERLEAERDAARMRLDQAQRGAAGARAPGAAPDALDVLLATPYRDAKAGFVERYLRDALRRAGGDVRVAAQATGLPLARLLGLMQHLDVAPDRPSGPGRPSGEGTWGGAARDGR